MQRFLGKLAPKIDPRTLMFAKYLSLAQLPSIPQTRDWCSNYTGAWGMLGNDTAGDCTFASKGHLIMSWTAANGNVFIPSTSDVIDGYKALTGYDPQTGANDNGAVMLNVLNYMRNYGIAGHKIGAFAKVNTKNIQEVKTAIDMFGGIDLGFALPLTVQGLAEWKLDGPSLDGPSLDGPAEPGSWGGHCVCGLGYDDNYCKIITWGETLIVDWDFFTVYADEGYAIISPDFVTGVKDAPSGFAMNILNQDLNLLAA